MRENMAQWDFVAAAFVVGVAGTVLLVAWSLWAMVRAERRRDRVKGR